MSAFGGKADVNHCVGECPLIAISGHWWANENGGPREPDGTPHLHNRERPRERDWYSIRLAVHSGATSAGRKTMTTPKAKFAGLVLIAALCAGFTLGLTAPAGAGWYEGVAAYDRGDYATALREWRPLAEQGDAKAQFNLGVMYYNGQGVPKEYAEAVKWYRKSAEQGDANAQYSLGQLYRKGQGAPQDYAKAMKWFRKAADQGDAESQYNLGVMYDEGLGVPQDDAEAVGWWRKAAEQGYTKAQHNLGVRYAKGQGVPRDYAKALQWYRKAAEQGAGRTQYNLGLMYYTGQGAPQDYVQAHVWINLAVPKLPRGEGRDKAVKLRDLIAKRMTPAQISEAQKLAREWRPK